MGSSNLPGGASPGITTSYQGYGGVYSDGVYIPNGRQCASGAYPIIVVGITAYVAGKGAARTVRFELGGGVSDWFGTSSGSSARATGVGLSAYFGGATSTRFTIRGSDNGQFYFGRASSGGNSTAFNGATWAGSLAGTFDYVESPSAPQSLSAQAGVGQATLNWVAPASNGGTGITDYVIHYGTDPAFGSYSTTTSGTTSKTVTGLSPTTYYFRVAARNAVTNAAGSWSLYSTTAAATTAYAPDAVTGLTVYSTDFALAAECAVPANNGAPILDYTLQVDTSATFSGPTNIVSASPVFNVSGLAANTTVYYRARARNSVGNGTWSTSGSVTPRKRTLLDNVLNASVQFGGLQVWLDFDGTSAVTLKYSNVSEGTTATTIATVPTGTSSSQFALPGTTEGLSLCSDAAGNLYVTGRRGSNTSQLLIRRYQRTATTTWVSSGSTSVSLPVTSNPLTKFASAYMTGTGLSPLDSLFVMARRDGSLATGNLSFAVVRATDISLSVDNTPLSSGSDPAWASAPPSVGASFYNKGLLDVTNLSGTRVAFAANGFGVIDITNGAISSVAKSADGTNWSTSRHRIVPISATQFARLSASGTDITVTLYSSGGVIQGTATIPAADGYGGTFTDEWDAYYDSRRGVIVVYYTADTGSGRTIVSRTIHATTYVVSNETTLTTTMGPTSSVNTALRLPHGAVDERRVLLTASADVAGTKSLSLLNDTSGNVAPSGPSLNTRSTYDGILAAQFAWTFGDNNALDTQTAYEAEMDNLSGPTSAYASGKVASTVSNFTLGASALANNANYRWRVRTWDALDTMGTWSAYSTFSTNDRGSATVTSPASDNPASDTNFQAITWSYSTTGSSLQQAYRVMVKNNATDAVLSDTGWVSSTDTTFIVTGLLSDVEQRVEVYVRNALGQETAAATRLLTPSYGAPMTPVVDYLVSTNNISVLVDNPTPEGSRPTTQYNELWKRAVDDGDAVLVATLEVNGRYDDYVVGSDVAYEYFVRAVATGVTGAYSDSAPEEVVALPLVGVWIHASSDPASTLINFPFGNTGRSETLGVSNDMSHPLGREWAVVDFGVEETLSLALSIMVPWDESHDTVVGQTRDLLMRREILVYRDNRSRVALGTISELVMSDEQVGTVITATFNTDSLEG